MRPNDYKNGEVDPRFRELLPGEIVAASDWIAHRGIGKFSQLDERDISVGTPVIAGENYIFVRRIPTGGGAGDGRNWIDQVVAWSMTERGGVQLSLAVVQPLAACESKFGLCE